MAEDNVHKLKNEIESVQENFAKPKFRDVAYYENRAEESRALANYLHEPFARHAMFKVAEDYDKMAEMIRRVMRDKGD